MNAARVRLTPDGGYAILAEDGDAYTDTNAFLESVRLRGLSPLTARSYAYDLLALHGWLLAEGRVLRALHQSDLLSFVAHQKKRSAAAETINRRLMTCRLLYRFCTGTELPWDAGAVADAPHYRGRGRDRWLGLHVLHRKVRCRLRVKTPERVVEPLDVDQVRQFLATLRRYRDLAIVHLMLLCGLRSREVLQIEMADVEWHERRLRVRGKGRRERSVPLPEVLVHVVRDYLRLERPRSSAQPHLFVVLQGAERGQAMTPSGLRSLFRHRRQIQGLAPANPHRFRHTFGADMAREGVQLPVLQRLMGHADSITTLRYIRLSMTDIAGAYHRALTAIERRYEPE